jgi:Holliday junction resolvase RusA-like endonuclease
VTDLDCGHPHCVTATGIRVFVAGKPAPQGSKRYLGGGRVIESSAKTLAPWRADVRDAFTEPDRPRHPLIGPVAVALVFVLARPKGHYRTGRNAHLLRDSAPTAPAGKPDIDKLSRAVLDAIGSAKTVWVDDSQVADLHAIKRYAELGEATGCHIHITTLEDR